jgi:hypothetical protein
MSSAHKWFNLAAAAGNQDALHDRDVTAHQMTPAQIAEAQRLAREWKPRLPNPQAPELPRREAKPSG